MRHRVVAALLSVCLVTGPAGLAKRPQPEGGPDETVEAELVRLTEEISESIRVGDRSVLERLGAPELTLVNRDGKTYTKAEFLADLVPPRPGYDLRFSVKEPRLFRQGDMAVLTFVLDEYLTIWGQDMSTDYRTTIAWVRRDGRWQAALYQYFERPVDPAVVPLSPESLDEYVGTYEIAAGRWVTRIAREGSKLTASRDGGTAREIKPSGGGRFYYPGVEGELLFVRDRSGKVTGMAFRRNFKDLLYRRVG